MPTSFSSSLSVSLLIPTPFDIPLIIKASLNFLKLIDTRKNFTGGRIEKN